MDARDAEENDYQLRILTRDITHYEVIRVLLHDLLHRVGEHQMSLDALLSKQRLLFGDNQTYSHLRDIVLETQSTFKAVRETVDRIRIVPYQAEYEAKRIAIADVVSRAVDT